MSRNRIVIGGMEFLDHQLNSGSVYIANSIAGDELGIDTMDAELDCSGWARTLFRPKNSAGLMTEDDLIYSVAPRFLILSNDVTKFSYGEKVYYYHDGMLIGKFYLSTVKRVGKYLYEMSCVSAIGLLDTSTHYGGLYTGESLSTVLSDIIGSVVPYTVQSAVQSIHVYGWLPVSTRRDNLRQLLFASGCALKKDTAGELNVCQLNLDSPRSIGEDRLMMGGSVDYPSGATEAVVVEHGYFKASNATDETLYDDGVQGAEITSPKGVKMTGSILTFDSPVYDLKSEGGGILESGVNYAVLAASGLTKLTGKKYAHTTREVFAKAAGVTVGETNIARVEDATLVNAANSDAVAARVASFYAKSRTVNMDMVMGTERPGDAVSFQDPFGEDTAALILSQDINMSGTLTASASFLAGYVPESGGVYENSRVLTGSGTYTPPSGTRRIRVVLIGGGHGGSRGENGENGAPAGVATWSGYLPGFTMQTKAYNNGYAGEGGAPGQPGGGGNIYQVTLNLSGGESYSYSCGTGGASENSGGNTTFGSFSSSSGSPSSTGYVNIMTGELYAGSGKTGISGGRGSGRPRNADIPTNSFPVEEGESITGPSGVVWKPGSSTEDRSQWARIERTYDDVVVGSASGSYGGGGPAYGSNGNDGQNGTVNALYQSYDKTGYATAKDGQGGRGANAIAPAKETRYGFGGTGGNGGGGGGGGPANGASISIRNSAAGIIRSFDVEESSPGDGGSGSAGGAGGDGCIIIYW